MNDGLTFAFVAVGANVRSRGETLEMTVAAAVERIAQTGESLTSVSRFFNTPCFPAGAGPDYVNAVVAISTSRPAGEILDHLHRVEKDFGRERVERWGMRTLDLDLLALGNKVLPDLATYQDWAGLPLEKQRLRAPGQLILPHPRMHERAFILVPLADIAPDWVHPVLNQSVARMLSRLPEDEIMAVKPL